MWAKFSHVSVAVCALPTPPSYSSTWYPTTSTSRYAKQTRTHQYKSVAERDKAIDDEVKSLRQTAAAKKKLADHVRAEIARLRKEIEENKEEVEEQKEQVEDRKKAFAEIQTALVDMRKTRDTLQNQRQDAWKQESLLESRRQELKKEVGEAERVLFSTTSKQSTKGIEAVWELQREENLDGILGPLYDLISCPVE